MRTRSSTKGDSIICNRRLRNIVNMKNWDEIFDALQSSSEKMKKYKRSKEEIAREFDLPERQSKIATIMKQDGQVYCICRSSDCSRFMIGCDCCEGWYHGDCINITEKESKHIKHYYCQKCREEDPSLQIIFRVIPMSTSNSVTSSQNNGIDVFKQKKPKVPENNTSNRCGTCDGCRTPNCGSCDSCLVRVGHKPRCELRICVNQNGIKMEKPVRRKRKEKLSKDRSKKSKRSPSPEMYRNPELEGIRQCYGPRCRMSARPQSKYCSDECGIALASNRIFQVLPSRLLEGPFGNCRADEESKKQLDQIRYKLQNANIALKELEKRHMELDLIVERAKRSTVDTEAGENNDVEDEQSMYCITCGHEIHSRTAIKHMEKCFNKYESQASFGSTCKTKIDGNTMFCDFYNPASKTYCKRLRVLCPEHCKDPKINDNDVCGCPIVINIFTITAEFCRAPKKYCYKHYMWEKIRRAEIDLERVRQWLKLDDLLEQERQIRHQMSSRSSLLGLMLHSTYDHDFLDEILRLQMVVEKAPHFREHYFQQYPHLKDFMARQKQFEQSCNKYFLQSQETIQHVNNMQQQEVVLQQQEALRFQQQGMTMQQQEALLMQQQEMRLQQQEALRRQQQGVIRHQEVLPLQQQAVPLQQQYRGAML
ncbi:CXXC-type zinc finger protein 1-like [Teleopsis dalmanni]|uniref:CXXC-type zinc finger protein 1-like n=1 Tax=Teleopsis dalmanni TaxID=139649 RepID=UPI0018CD458A|nr:CXXC-type zinc finger protein 1-like [Teleopsis dalmanni]XP_037936052.1 CXXC-type zinc finger protein 1-like [Teleopsis dalmanni]